MTQPRPLAIIVHGPQHLFHAVGTYHTFELQKTFDIVLVVPDSYKSNPQTERVFQLPGVREVVLLPGTQDNFDFHGKTHRIAQRLAGLSPALLLQHSDNYPHNFYFSQAMPETCVQGTFANGLTLDQDVDFSYVRHDRIATMARRLRFPIGIVSCLYGFRERWNDLRFHSLFPFLLTGRIFRPSQNTVTGRNGAAAPYSRFRMMYTQREMAWHRKAVPDEKIGLVQSPLTTIGAELHTHLNLPEQQTNIAFLPTWAVLAMLATKMTPEQAHAAVFETWRDTLRALRQRLGALPILAKLHPAAAKDPASQRLMQDLSQAVEGLTIVPPSTSAESLILSSTCVVGDFSSVLWWAYLLGGRIIVSVDPWSLPGADEMKHYPGIVYVNSPAQITDAPLQAPTESRQSAPTVTQFLLDLIDRRHFSAGGDQC